MLVLLGKLSCSINLSEKICSSHRIEGSRKVRELPRATYTIESPRVCQHIQVPACVSYYCHVYIICLMY